MCGHVSQLQLQYVQYMQYVLYSSVFTVCTVCIVCTVQYVQYVQYVQNVLYSMYSMYCTVCTYVQYVRMYLVPNTWYLVCIQIHPYASVCTHMHPSRIRMHPYASIRLIYASERQYSTHSFAGKVIGKKIVKIAKFSLQSGA